MNSRSVYFNDNLNSIHLDLSVGRIFFSELLININRTLLFGSSMDLSNALVELALRYSRSSIIIDFILLSKDE